MRRPPLPLPTLAATRSRLAVYGLVTLNAHGRIADRSAMKVLQWAPGLRLSIRERHGLIVVSADQQGVFKVAKEGHVRLPAVVRQWCGLAAGDRVLIVAEPASGRLVVHPPAKLDELITQAHDAVFGGEHE
ncbi:AbrB/MazE/SpoVT family DNA-binding domain-containing protein [Micromonospora sp. SD19]|uniref:SpoVT-AbrB domain-containing protein n=2 Tax=Micromonospora saelicesensis TaxID=285676 RepID=A0A1C4Z2D0_9ACTN|nr:hypothetical protein GA0070561_4832 [Micromonospora saelicesensis]